MDGECAGRVDVLADFAATADGLKAGLEALTSAILAEKALSAPGTMKRKQSGR